VRGSFVFEGASGSTHKSCLTGSELIERVSGGSGQPTRQGRGLSSLAAVKRLFKFRVREFNEAEEDARVTEYCRKYVGATVNR
jgi:hypothetical protein